MSNPPKFWMVHGIGQGSPRVIHESHESAMREAKRLAQAHPDIWFCVLEATSATIRKTTHTVTLREAGSIAQEISDDDIPF